MALHPLIRQGNDSRVMVPITPMLDFTFQLLFFFIITSHPSRPEGEMDLSLDTAKPAVAQENRADVLDKAPGEQEDEPKEPPEVTVIIETFPGGEKTGKIQEIFLTLKEKPDDKISVNAEGWDADNPRPLLLKLQEQLKKLRETLNNKTDIIMKGDRKVKWQYVVQVRDACEKAGFTNAHFARK